MKRRQALEASTDDERSKDYFGSVHCSDDDLVFHGKVEFMRALVSYEGTDVESLRRAFEEAVDDYLELCRRQKREPEKPMRRLR